MKINLDFFNKSTGLVLVFASLVVSVIAFAGTLNINGDVNSTGSVKQGGNILVPSGAIMAFDLTSCPAGWIFYDVSIGHSLVQAEYTTLYNGVKVFSGVGYETSGLVMDHYHAQATESTTSGNREVSTFSGKGIDYEDAQGTVPTSGVLPNNGGVKNYAAGKKVIFCRKN